MALSQTIVWTTLPHGRVELNGGDKALRVSVHVSPRLTPGPDEMLKPFACFLNWPKVAATLKFKLVFDGGPSGELEPLAEPDALDPDLWARIFDEETFVRGHAFRDLKDEAIRSFPAAEVNHYVHELYGETAEKHGTEFPAYGDNADTPLSRLKAELGPLSDPGRWQRHDKLLGEMLRKDKVLPPFPSRGSGLTPMQYAFFQAQRFYRRPQLAGSNPYRETPNPAYVPVEVEKPEFDFHQALAALADYPRLLRRLGLVLDFFWKPDAAVPPQGHVRVEVEWGDPHVLPAWHVPDRPPWTEYALTSRDFRARGAAGLDTEMTRGQLDLREVKDARPNPDKLTAYSIAQVDVDGSALKTLNTAGSLARMERTDVANYRTPQQSDLPALRTASLALYRRQRAQTMHAQLVRAATAQAQFVGGVRPSFFADDLLRGYRIDVWDDKSGQWQSLCVRRGEYRFIKRGEFELELSDEGYLKSASASQGEKGTPTDLYVHERLAGFDGWSLVASRPGRTLDRDPTATDPVVPQEDAATEFGIATRFFVPPGSLPRLRYGRRYRFRVRLVDLAGNSPEFESAGEDSASQPFLYCRYEPVPSPVVLLRERPTEGESLEHLVIRSDYDRTAVAYAGDPAVEAVLEKVRDRLELTGADRAAYSYRAENERHVAPPKISQLEAETHGRFDDYLGPGKDHAKGRRLALRESATFLSQKIVNLDTGAEEPIPGLQLDTVPPTGKARTNLNDPARQPGDPLQEGEMVLHREAQLVVPYLADPFAAAVAFVGLPGVAPGEPFIVPLDGDWPNVRPFRIRLVERPGVLNQCAQVFADAGAPSWDAEKRVLTVAQPKGVVTTARYSSVLPTEAAARQMGLWKMLEQRGSLTAAMRKAILAGRHWMFTPWRTLTLAHVVQHPLCPPTIQIFAAGRNIGDTFADLRGKWHLSIKSTDKVDVLAAWTEPLDDPAQRTWQLLERSGHAAELKMNPAYADELEVPPPVNPLVPRARLPLRHEFGDTKHRVVRYRLKGTTRFREYFPVELTHDDTAITRVGAEFTVNVPSSARPVAPLPLYVLPTFRWEETALPNNGLIRKRLGHGLRVYLERPWWSSGDSERLGVVFRPGTIPADSKLKPYVTQWGLDPVFDSAAPVAGPTLAAFPLATDTRSNVSIAEVGDGQDIFTVAGHAVEFDPERKLWFADLVVNAGSSYFPFVRLALARFQPFSIEDCHLSRVVLTDFVQLVPDRTLDVRWIAANRVRVKIYGVAPTETFASRVLQSLAQVRTDAQAKSATMPLKDVLSEPLTRAKLLAAVKAPLTSVVTTPGGGTGVVRPAPEPAPASSRFGLNEYSVELERLPANESPDFGWEAVTGLLVTKPSTGPGAIGGLTATPATSVAGRASKAVSKKALAAKVKRGTAATDLATGGVIATGPVFQIKPLWEADVTLPTANDNQPRRLVVREHELYFKATAQPNEFLPIARRLVYVDIVDLSAPVA